MRMGGKVLNIVSQAEKQRFEIREWLLLGETFLPHLRIELRSVFNVLTALGAQPGSRAHLDHSI